MLWLGIYLPQLALEVFERTAASTSSLLQLAVCDRLHVLLTNQGAQALGVRNGIKRATALALAPDLLLIRPANNRRSNRLPAGCCNSPLRSRCSRPPRITARLSAIRLSAVRPSAFRPSTIDYAQACRTVACCSKSNRACVCLAGWTLYWAESGQACMPWALARNSPAPLPLAAPGC
jgi:hypothetical protein